MLAAPDCFALIACLNIAKLLVGETRGQKHGEKDDRRPRPPSGKAEGRLLPRTGNWNSPCPVRRGRGRVD